MNAYKRLKIFFVLFVIVLLVLAMRLAYIQIHGGDELAIAASRQQRIRLDGIDSRGTIYDRNGMALTGSYREYVYIIKKDVLDERALQLLDYAGAEKLSGYSNIYSIFSTDKYAAIPSKTLKNDYYACIMEVNRRYQSGQTAAHIIGYVNPLDEKGVSGVELMCDNILSRQGTKMYAIADARGKIIRGYGVTKVSADETSHVMTTLDGNLQKFCENELGNSDNDGAVVVLESDTGAILAAASTPTFNPNSPADYTKSKNNELFNKAIQGEYPPGSIFKIVVAAAALEYGVKDALGNEINLNTKFVCEGEEELYGITIGCQTGGEEGHGSITLKRAMAQSCNCAFVQLGSMVGGEKILRMAHTMGLGQQPYEGIAEAASGNLTAPKNTKWAGIGNLSIGQGELLLTPLQAARMINIIANGGVDVGIELIRKDGAAVASKTAGSSQGTRVISRRTAELLDEMLNEVMQTGTGRRIDGWGYYSTSGSFDIGGKTGSAEASDVDSQLVHGWFTGYFKAKNSSYTVAIFMENGQSGRGSALPVFSSIFDYVQHAE